MNKKPLPSVADDDISVRAENLLVNLCNMLGRVELEMVGFDGSIAEARAPAARYAECGYPGGRYVCDIVGV
jgi:hypothetical protein